MLEIFRRKKYEDEGTRRRGVISDWMGYPRSDYSRYDPYGEENWSPERKSIHALEGAGRRGWDYDQNRGYGMLYGSQSRPAGNHYGKGPRNYQRPDERIREDIHEGIVADWRVEAEDVNITVKEGIVQLSGFVRDRSIRHRLEDIAEAIRGVKEVENRIRVVK